MSKTCGDTLVSINCNAPVTGRDAGELVFSSLEDNTEAIFIFNKTGGVSLSCDKNWLNIDLRPVFTGLLGCEISVDWDALTEDSDAVLTIKRNEEEKEIKIKAKVFDASFCKQGTFVESLGYIGISAGCFTDSFAPDGSGWLIMQNYGKALSAVKPYPIGKDYADAEAPSLTYRFVINNEETYHINFCFTPNNNPRKDSRVRFITELDGEIREMFMLPENYGIGTAKDADWCKAVLDNQRKASFDAKLSKGEHVLVFKAPEAGAVIEKIEINSEKDDSFYGCPFTYIRT